MQKAGISLQVHYIPLHLQPYMQRHYGFKAGDFPHTERFYREAVSLPIYPLLTDDEVKMVAERLIETLKAPVAL